MTVVLDVSGVIEILLQKKKAPKFNKAVREGTLIITPDLYISELTNTFWKYYAAKEFTKEECIQNILDGIKLISKFMDSNDIWQEAFAEGISNNHSIYDMFYMVAARRNNGILITNDSILASICKKNHVEVCY